MGYGPAVRVGQAALPVSRSEEGPLLGSVVGSVLGSDQDSVIGSVSQRLNPETLTRHPADSPGNRPAKPSCGSGIRFRLLALVSLVQAL